MFPSSLALNTNNSNIYVANGDNTFSVIDLSGKIIGGGEIGSSPYDIAINPKTNIVYFAGHDSKAVFTVNGSNNKVVTGVTFHIYPHKSGDIKCDGKDIPEDTFVRVDVQANCNPHPKEGYTFSSWSSTKF